MVEGRRDDARVPFDRFGRAMLRAASATAVARDDASTAREGLSTEPVAAVHQRSEAEYIILAETKSPSIVRRLHARSRRQGRRRGWQDAATGELAEECQPVDPEVQPAPRVTSEVEREGPIVAERAHDHLVRVRVGFGLE